MGFVKILEKDSGAEIDRDQVLLSSMISNLHGSAWQQVKRACAQPVRVIPDLQSYYD